ncbi:MAG TPA: T9SS type A sorting domain-containing protein [Chitinophagaceae bacterium]
MNRFLKFSGYSLLVLLFVACKSVERDDEEERGEADNVQYLIQQEVKMTRDLRLNYVPRERLAAAKAYMESLTARTEALAWTERGPNNVGGRTRAMIVDKRDATGNTVFAASVSGGLFKTTNFTAPIPSWTVINDFLPNLAITALVQDNANPNIMYAGTGEGWFNVDAVVGNGIYKSTDGGTTWTVLPSTVSVIAGPPIEIRTFEFVQDLAIDNNGAVYASLRNLRSTSRGVHRSTDGGATWTQVLGAPLINPTTGLAFATGRAADLEVASNGDVYASLGLVGEAVTNRSIVMKSSFATHGANTGALGNWVDITPVTPTVTQRTEIIVAPSDANRVYLLMQDSATHQVLNIFRSTNAGSSWTTLGTADALNNGTNSQTWYNLIGAVDPTNPDIVVVGGLHLGRSVNGGDSWTTISSGSTVHVDQHALQFVSSSRLIAGNDGGIYYTSNFASTGTPSWVGRNNGFNVTQFYGTDYHPTIANYFLAGAQDNGTQRFTSAGMNTTISVVGGDGGFCHIDQTEPNIQVSSQFGSRYAISNDGFSTFVFRDFNPSGGILGQFINPSDFDDNANLFYAGGDAGTYTIISNLVPANNTVISTRNIPAMGGRALTAVKVDPFSDNTIWVGASAETANSLPMVLKISNASSGTPTVVSSSNLTSDPNQLNAYVSSVDVDPANGNHIIATVSNYGAISVYESTNGGVSFTNIEGNLPDMPIRWVLFAPATAQLNGTTGGLGGVLLGTELGVWATSVLAGAATQWTPHNAGLANVRTDMLKVRPSDNTVIAATHGRGLFSAIIPTVPTGLPSIPVTKDFIKYTFTDNDQLHIVVGSLPTKNITIQLQNMLGQQLYQTKGNYQNTTVDLSRYQDGVYILRIFGDQKEQYVQQFVKR